METPSEHLTDSNDLGDVLKNTSKDKKSDEVRFWPVFIPFSSQEARNEKTRSFF